MPSDQAPQIESAPSPNWELPQIADVSIRNARYEPRPTRNFVNPRDAVSDAVEIVVSLQSPLPIRAMAPVLWVGDERLTESEAVDREGKQIRFWGLNRSGLQDGAPITLAWMNEEPQAPRDTARFTYRAPR
jgi:hypothetical protein